MRYIIVFDREKCRGVVEDDRMISDLENRWFGYRENGKYYLYLIEIAYLLLSSKTLVLINGKPVIEPDEFFKEAQSCLEDFFWTKLIVYKDLRDRGRRVKVLDNDKFLAKDKHGYLRMIVVLEEGSERSVPDILKHIDSSMDNNLKLVYAIVSLQGDLTYYELTRIDPRRD